VQLIWRPSARGDLREIIDFISDRNPDAAERLNVVIERAAEQLTLHPYMGRPGRVPSSREMIAHPNYILIYEVDTDRVTILAVIHARQQYP